jgi:predicted SPOUT superfamily RNA methylase MTH1
MPFIAIFSRKVTQTAKFAGLFDIFEIFIFAAGRATRHLSASV